MKFHTLVHCDACDVKIVAPPVAHIPDLNGWTEFRFYRDAGQIPGGEREWNFCPICSTKVVQTLQLKLAPVATPALDSPRTSEERDVKTA